MSKKNKKEKVMPSIFAWNVYSLASKIYIRFLNRVSIALTQFNTILILDLK